MAAGTTITNWFGDLVSHPRVVVEATSVNDIVKILIDPDQYPSPVRAVGSNHSTSPVGVAEGGTLIKMSRMNRILEIGTDTVTVQAAPSPSMWPTNSKNMACSSTSTRRSAACRWAARPGQLVNCETEC